jgi:hypothetical protein
MKVESQNKANEPWSYHTVRFFHIHRMLQSLVFAFVSVFPGVVDDDVPFGFPASVSSPPPLFTSVLMGIF